VYHARRGLRPRGGAFDATPLFTSPAIRESSRGAVRFAWHGRRVPEAAARFGPRIRTG
jgi:hypothetical protein